MTRHVFNLRAHFFALLPQKRSGGLPKSVALAIWFRMSRPLTTHGLSDSMLHCSTNRTYWSLFLSFACRLHSPSIANACTLRPFRLAALCTLNSKSNTWGGGWGKWVGCGPWMLLATTDDPRLAPKPNVMALGPHGSFPHVRECIGRPNTRFIGNEITKSTMYIHNISGTTLSQSTVGP